MFGCANEFFLYLCTVNHQNPVRRDLVDGRHKEKDVVLKLSAAH